MTESTLNGLVAAMLAVTPDLHVLRDPTRGGLAATLNEIAVAAGVGVSITETAVPVPECVAYCADVEVNGASSAPPSEGDPPN